jgi:CRP/FNR family transcriptional regulator, cyclic AMP receptor protein
VAVVAAAWAAWAEWISKDSLFSVATYAMKTMIPLRILALGSNLFSAAYGFDQAIYPMLVLHLVLMPINSYRLYEMVNLVRRVKKSSRSGFDMKWLKPFMSRSSARAGEVLFRKGDSADAMYLVISGRFVLSETGIEIPHGSVVGEFGLFAPGGCRTQTLQCLESGEILTISYEHFKQLYFQNPEFRRCGEREPRSFHFPPAH